MRRRFGLGPAGAGLAALVYVAFRVAIELGIRGHGRHPTGMLEGDSYYPLAFARELHREGSWLLFHNPYGTLDQSAGLFDGLALVLRVLQPLWDGHLFVFDVAVGCLASALAGYCVGRLCGLVSRQSAVVTASGLVLLIAGTGVAFLAFALGLADNRADLSTGTWWGVSWVTNQLATWELVYHAVWWAGALAIVTRRERWAWAAGAALAFLHPFSFATYVLFAAAVWVGHRVHGHADSPRFARILVPLGGAAVVVGVVYEIVLPALSKDADFLRQVYRAQAFAIPTAWLLMFVAPAALLFVLLFAFRERGTRSGDPWS